MFAHRVFSTHDELVCKFETLRKRVTSATMRNSRIAKIFPGLAGISIGKWPSIMEKHSRCICLRGHISQAQAWLLARFMTLWRRHFKLSRDTKIIENRHRELCQPYAGKLTKVRKLCRKSDKFFPLGKSPSCIESSQLTASWSVSSEF